MPMMQVALHGLNERFGPAGIRELAGADVDLSASAREFEALLCEFKTDLPAYFETYTGEGYPRTLQDVIDFNEANPELEGPWNSDIFVIAEGTGGRADPECQAARAETTAGMKAAVDAVVTDNNLDAIVALTNGPAWVPSARIGPGPARSSSFGSSVKTVGV